eukprot:Clim_evm7s251 gene=Clim_evmTU7s251
MAPIKIGFNGMGRVGLLACRAAFDRPEEFEVVHLNEINGTPESLAYYLNYDSVHGKWGKDIEVLENAIKINGKVIKLTAVPKPADIPWGESGVQIVFECTGKFVKNRDLLVPHLRDTVKKVVVSAPVKAPSADGTKALEIVYGINHKLYEPSMDIVTAASCTTNCLAPMVKVLHENFGIKHGMLTTLHNVTNTQAVHDRPHSHADMRRGRSALLSMVPTSTGSAKAITKIFPELVGKLDGIAIRVPLLTGSITDFVCELNEEVTVEEINAVYKKASEGELKGILGYETVPLVSSDFAHDIRSGIVDANSTMVTDKTQVKSVAWYDNEWAYSNRMVDIAAYVISKGL